LTSVLGRVLAAAALITLGACAARTEQHAPAIEERSLRAPAAAGAAGTAAPVTSAGAAAAHGPAAAAGETQIASAGAAALELLERARAAGERGDGELAGALLQRAIRLEPDNAWLWHRLAVLRLQQGLYQKAQGNARKSISLAGDNERLIAGNRDVIRRAAAALRP